MQLQEYSCTINPLIAEAIEMKTPLHFKHNPSTCNTWLSLIAGAIEILQVLLYFKHFYDPLTGNTWLSLIDLSEIGELYY